MHPRERGFQPWARVETTPGHGDPALRAPDPGEPAAIELGLAVKASLILMDDRRGAAAAAQKGFTVAGTLGVLDLAAERGLVDLARSLENLKGTNFGHRQEMLDALLKKREGGGRKSYGFE